MYDFKMPKEWMTESVTADQLFSVRPCLVTHICLTATASSAATALIYDGESATSPLKLALACLTSTHFGDCFEIPVYFQRGVYVVLSGSPTLFTIQYTQEVKF